MDFDPYQSGGSLQRVATLFQDGNAIAHSPSLVSRLWIALAWFHCAWRCSLQRWRWWAARDDHCSQKLTHFVPRVTTGAGLGARLTTSILGLRNITRNKNAVTAKREKRHNRPACTLPRPLGLVSRDSVQDKSRETVVRYMRGTLLHNLFSCACEWRRTLPDND